ncbi:MAG: signal peptidase I [Clostridia bacterium]|nr:signal peptidase I [Clostridia bacterium]
MRKALHIIKTIFVWLLMIAAVAMVVFTIISKTTLDHNDRSLFGFKFFIVQTDSMSKTDFSAGDLIFVRTVEPSTLKEGDIITFVSKNSESFGQTITHKIRKLTADAKGAPAFVTYGTTTGSDDEEPVGYSDIVGKYIGHIPKAGTLLSKLQTPTGFIVCVVVPFGIFLILQGFSIVRTYRSGKKEEENEMEEERKRIEEEKKKSDEMYQKLQEMQAMLLAQQASMQQQNAQQPAPPADSTAVQNGDNDQTVNAQPAENVETVSDTEKENRV